MLSYIASNPINELIKLVCKELDITILSQIGEIDFLQYIKQTKVNFKLIKYMIIDLNSLKGTEENKINSISCFKEVYPNIRVIILASGYDEQNIVLTTLYEKGIYNIINSDKIEQIKEELKKSLTISGITKKDSSKFKRTEINKSKKNSRLKEKLFKIQKIFDNKNKEKTQVNNTSE